MLIKLIIIRPEEIIEIINKINRKENSKFREMMQIYVFKIIYNINQKDLNKLLDDDNIMKYYLDKFNIFDKIEYEKKYTWIC